MAVGAFRRPRAPRWCLAALALALAGPAAAQERADAAAVPLNEARVAAVIEACGERDTEAFLAERLAARGLKAPGEDLDEALGLSVDRALDPAKPPERAAVDLSELIARVGTDDVARARFGYYVLRNFAYYEALNCHALREWLRPLVVYRDLLDGAAEGDPNRGYYLRALDQARRKLAISLRQRDRLAEKERLALAAAGLAAP